mmetsp:Transcript_12593/g.23738  ORF Transcript_12593/g.23738 Transcript_12593/m.23738 type:complete len:218 (+) Transcript_12593:538-1191(+)
MWAEGAHTGFECSCQAAQSNMDCCHRKVMSCRSVSGTQSCCAERDLHKARSLESIHFTQLFFAVKPLQLADGSVPRCIDHNYHIRICRYDFALVDAGPVALNILEHVAEASALHQKVRDSRTSPNKNLWLLTFINRAATANTVYPNCLQWITMHSRCHHLLCTVEVFTHFFYHRLNIHFEYTSKSTHLFIDGLFGYCNWPQRAIFTGICHKVCANAL